MKKVIFIVTVFFQFVIFGQQDIKPCGHTLVTNKLWAKNPQLEADYHNMIRNLLKNSKGSSKTTTYTIPLVFHVIHEYGVENITDAQIFDAVAILNEDYRKMNADTTAVVDQFENLIADCHIEFSLASIDYNGNCTNGIEHINSHETNIGDDFSKIHQWDRNKYLNIWVVKSMRDGVAGYAYYPSDIGNSNRFADGVIILSDYIGSIGTGSSSKSRALTHEIGHYLGLSHPWGSTNSPGVACGDDDVPDTPITKGFDFCPSDTTAAKICNLNIVENYQNFMDYSYCSHMFTLDQSTIMTGTINTLESYRDLLVADQTMIETGALANPKPQCKPVADFSSNFKTVCAGDQVLFKDHSWNSAVVSRQWIFQDGTPQTSTVASPSVSFGSEGWKSVTLIVQGANGSDTMEIPNYIYISGTSADLLGPKFEDFNSTFSNWFVENPENNLAKWELIPYGGKYGTPCFKIQNYFEEPVGTISDDEDFYNDRLGGNKDALISPAFDLSTTADAVLSFDYSFATKGTIAGDLTETMNVYISKNCGKTWILKKTLTSTDLLSAGNFSYDFYPNSDDLWKTCVIDLGTAFTSNDTRTRFKFEFVSSDKSNNIFFDNFNLNGVLGIEANTLNDLDLKIYPNPKGKNEQLNISFMANDEAVSFELLNVNSQSLLTKKCDLKNQEVNFDLLNGMPVAAGCYFLKITQGNNQRIEKIIVE